MDNADPFMYPFEYYHKDKNRKSMEFKRPPKDPLGIFGIERRGRRDRMYGQGRLSLTNCKLAKLYPKRSGAACRWYVLNVWHKRN